MKKKIKGRLSVGVCCPDCGSQMRVTANADYLKCMNPTCKGYGKRYDLPEVILVER